MSAQHKSLVIFVDETDMWQESRLYEAIVTVLERNGIAGATVNSGFDGVWTASTYSPQRPFGVSDDRPVTIITVDTDDKIRSVLPTIIPMVREGLIMLQEAEVISTGSADIERR